MWVQSYFWKQMLPTAMWDTSECAQALLLCGRQDKLSRTVSWKARAEYLQTINLHHPHFVGSIYATLYIYLGIFFPTLFLLLLPIQLHFDSAWNHSLWQTVSFHTAVQSCQYQLPTHRIRHVTVYYQPTVPSWLMVIAIISHPFFFFFPLDSLDLFLFSDTHLQFCISFLVLSFMTPLLCLIYLYCHFNSSLPTFMHYSPIQWWEN